MLEAEIRVKKDQIFHLFEELIIHMKSNRISLFMIDFTKEHTQKSRPIRVLIYEELILLKKM